MMSCSRSYPLTRRAQDSPRYTGAPQCVCHHGGALISSPTMFFAPFLFLYAIIFFVALALVFGLLELGAIDYAFNALGLPPHAAFWALIVSLLGSYINIPISRIEGGNRSGPSSPDVVSYFGMPYGVPARPAA